MGANPFVNSGVDAPHDAPHLGGQQSQERQELAARISPRLTCMMARSRFVIRALSFSITFVELSIFGRAPMFARAAPGRCRIPVDPVTRTAGREATRRH